jgi:serine/threonine-protein kinase
VLEAHPAGKEESPTRRLAHFELRQKLGEGGMGTVYLAWDTQLRRKVALKLIRGVKASDRERQRLLLEARTASNLAHPNIVTIFGLFEDQNQLFCAMEYVEGETLEDLLRRGALPIPQVLQMAGQMASAIAYAHQHGVIHRDIKPANIMITIDGNIKILDFGLARPTAASEDQQLVEDTSLLQTRDGQIRGTLPYMAPEQLNGQRADAKSEIFSFGCVLYEMLAGQRPFPAANPVQIRWEILQCKPVPLAQLLGCHHELHQVVEQCLRADPESRFLSMKQISLTLDVLNSPPLPATRRWPLWLGLALALASLGLLFVRPQAASGPPQTIQKIAVLPFQNLGADPANQIFCDGFSAQLSGQLAEYQALVPGSWVVPPTEIRRLEQVSGPNLYQNFGVTHVLSGTMRQMGTLRELTLELIDARSLSLLKTWRTPLEEQQLFRAEEKVLTGALTLLDWPSDAQQLQRMARNRTSVPDSYVHYVIGLGCLYRYDQPGNLERAIASFEQALQGDQGFSFAHVGLSQAYLVRFRTSDEDADLQKAEQAARQARAMRPDLALPLLCLGNVQLEKGLTEEAILSFREALQNEPRHGLVSYALAGALESSGHMEEAGLTYEQAAQLEPANWNGQTARARFFVQKGDLTRAEQVFRELIALAPENPYGYSNLGAVLFQGDHWEEARQMLEKAVELNPNGWNSLSNLATLLFFLADYEASAGVFERAHLLRPANYLVMANWGDALHQIPGRQQEAVRAWQEASNLIQKKMEEQGEQHQLLLDRSLLWAKLGMHEEALNSLARSSAEEISREEWVLRAQIHALCGQTGESRNILVRLRQTGLWGRDLQSDPILAPLNPPGE